MSDNGKTILGQSDFVDMINAAGNISSVPKAWLKSESRLLPEGTKQATAANIKAAQAKASAESGEKVDVDKLRADIEASVREEHEAALAERDARIAELEAQLQESADGDTKDDEKDEKPSK